uniref:Uncharacterized protein n=2 Tax=Oryza nivara TaxID=4536 RepID=A0A0E0HM52_ORYNI
MFLYVMTNKHCSITFRRTSSFPQQQLVAIIMRAVRTRRSHVQHSTLNSGLGPQVRRVGRCGREDRGARGSCVTCIGHSKPNPPQLGATV